MPGEAPSPRRPRKLASCLVGSAVLLSMLALAGLAYSQRQISQLKEELMGAGDHPRIWTVFDLWGLTGDEVLSAWAQASPRRLWISESRALVLVARYREVASLAGGEVRVEPIPPLDGQRGVESIMVFQFADDGSSARYQPIHDALDIESVSWLGERIFLEFNLDEKEALRRGMTSGEGWRATLTWEDLEAFVQPRIALPGSVPGRSSSLDWLLEKAGASSGAGGG